LDIRDLEFLLDQKESTLVEFKKDNTDPELVGKLVSAISNAAALQGDQCGHVIWGVDDSSASIVGTRFDYKSAKAGKQLLEIWLNTQVSPQVFLQFFEVRVEDLKVVVLRIPAAFSVPTAFKSERYIRIGSSCTLLQTYPETERALWRALDTLSFEEGVAASELREDDVMELLDTPSMMKLFNCKTLEPIELMLAQNLVKSQGAKFVITNLGALLFAKDIDQFSRLATKAIRVIVYTGNDRIHATREVSGRLGYATGFARLCNWIMSHLPTGEEIHNPIRQQASMYPGVAVRELVANALIHQDFMLSGSPKVEIFQNRIEISNPGASLIDPLRMLDQTPVSRNEKLSQKMRIMRLCEERGSGIDRVVDIVEAWHLPAPTFDSTALATTSTLFAPRSVNQMTKSDRVRAAYQHASLLCTKGDRMTNSTLRQRLNLQDRQTTLASKIIAETVEAKLIIPWDSSTKSRKHQSYVPFWART
jgi:ATP-dependent DNA helicase RecG